MPGAIQAKAAGEGAGAVEVRPVAAESRGVRGLGRQEPAGRSLDLGRAEVIVAVGRGLAGPEHLPLLQELAGLCERGALGASRPVVDAGWLPLEHQVGMTGQTVAPAVYIACGISGAIQHTQGMMRSGLIVAINSDPQAAIFQIAHLGVVQDLHCFLPVLIRKLREQKRAES
jgi:electron transfer flavoprotein alpha subunit